MPMRTPPARALTVLVAAHAIACTAPATRADSATPADEGPTSPTPAESVMIDDLRLSVRVEGTPSAGTAITFVVTVANEGTQAVVVDFPDGQRYDLEVFEGDRSVWRWGADMAFIQMIGQEAVEPGAPLEWTAVLADGLPEGSYRLLATLTSMEPATVETSFDVTG